MGRAYHPEAWRRSFEVLEPCFAAERRQLELGPHWPPEDIAEALRISEERYRYTVALSPLIPWIANAHGDMIDIDVRGLDCTGLSYDECLGTGFFSAVHPDDHKVVKQAWAKAQSEDLPLDYEMRLRLHDGSFRWHRCRAAPRLGDDGAILCWYGTIEDIDDRKRADQAMRWAANHDDLTGLWNRRAFMAGLRKALTAAVATDAQVGLVLIDLDGFKQINDRFGHDCGDELLKQVASRLEQFAESDTMVGRLGGDEFAMFVCPSEGKDFERSLARLSRVLSEPCMLNGTNQACRTSMGVARYPLHGNDADTLYKNADLALYEAKCAGLGVRHFQNQMRANLKIRMSELSSARNALDDEDVVPFYQPKVDLRTGSITGFEALLRLQNDTQAVRSPGAIAAAFDDAELAIALDERILSQVAADIAAWNRASVDFGRIAINVSAARFRQPDFAEQFLSQVESAGIDAASLELEVTEKVLLERNRRKICRLFDLLRTAGMTVALDDFGTGYASLIHLKQFPVDVLKIDCSFVQALEDDVNAAIVRAIVGLGQRLGITTVAEGIETRAQAERLYLKGCDMAQGFLFSKPLPAEDVPSILARKDAMWRPPERRSGVNRRAG